MGKSKKIICGIISGSLILAGAFTLAGLKPVEVDASTNSVVMSDKDNQTMFQAFEWYSSTNGQHWNNLANDSKELSDAGFTSVWLPPAYKGMGGGSTVGYDPYDLYDLGEFNQMGSVRTQYGTKDEYLNAINKLHENGISVYADAVMNHKAGADKTESGKAYKVSWSNRNYNLTSSPIDVVTWTVFTFPGRKGKYSKFKWDKSCFDGVDYDQKSGSNALYRFSGKTWDKTDTENGNYDYLMFSDVDLNSSKVRNELKSWGSWYVNFANLDGFRVDAVKHMEFSFVEDWITSVEKSTGKKLFAVSEYYSGDVNKLNNYIKETNGTTSLFDFPLYYKFKSMGFNSNLSQLNVGTLTVSNPECSVTFVENHDTQIGQSDSTVKSWFKPLAYTYILTRDKGYPCVFYGDYYGSGNGKTKEMKDVIDSLMIARKYFAYGDQVTSFFDGGKVMAWVRKGDTAHKNSGMAAVITTATTAKKVTLNVGKQHAGETWTDIVGNGSSSVKIGRDGKATFSVDRASSSVYVNKSAASKFLKSVGKVKSVKASSVTEDSVKLKWKNIDGCKYNVYKYSSSTKKWTKVASTDTNSVVVKKLGSATEYKFAVKAYSELGALKKYGTQSGSVTVTTKPKTVKLSATLKKTKITLKWSNASKKADGYEIYMRKTKNGKYKKVKTVSKGSAKSVTISGLKKGTTYYYKVVSYKKYKPQCSKSKVKLYSSSSNKIKAVVK